MKIGIVNNNYRNNCNIVPVFKNKIKKAKTFGYALTAAAMMSFSACNSCNKNISPDNTNYGVETNAINNSSDISAKKNPLDNKRAQKYYHYFPSENNITAENYAWSEIVYPDGRVEKDSLGHNISISPDGKRTVIKTEKDDQGFTKITKSFPDGSKIIHNDYSKNGDSTYTEKVYWPNGNLKENSFYSEYFLPDSTNNDSTKIIEKSYERYNENEVLIYWESDVFDSDRNEKHNKYDRQKRIIYDDIKNEHYQYKGNSSIPYQSYSEYEGCKRITLYNPDSTVNKIYFEAADGTITDK